MKAAIGGEQKTESANGKGMTTSSWRSSFGGQKGYASSGAYSPVVTIRLFSCRGNAFPHTFINTARCEEKKQLWLLLCKAIKSFWWGMNRWFNTRTRTYLVLALFFLSGEGDSRAAPREKIISRLHWYPLCPRDVLTIFRVWSFSPWETKYRALIYDVSWFQKCNFYLIRITSKF